MKRKLKSKKSDFTEANLPSTRGQVFCDCYKEHFSELFRVGLICMVALLPVLVVTVLRDTYVIGMASVLEEQTDEAIRAIHDSASAIFGLFYIIAFPLSAALLAGPVRILRQLLWGEPLFFGDDFKNGFKSDAFRFALIAFLLAIQYYLLNMLQASWPAGILFGVFAIFILPVAMWMLLQTVYYSLKFSAELQNAVLYYFKAFPGTVLLVIGTALPFLLVQSIGWITAKYIVFLLIGVFFVVPLIMAWLLYASHTFDRLLNREHYPEIYRKGMQSENENIRK